MEAGNNGSSGLHSYYQARVGPSAADGIFSSPAANNNPNVASSPPLSEVSSFLFSPHSVGGRVTTTTTISTVPEVVRRKRGRPRKYGLGTEPTGDVGLSSSAVPRKKQPGSSKKAQMAAFGNAGQGFTPHVIMVAAGEDVSKKIMSFMQQQKHAVCILSANGSISNASLLQPAMSGGTVAYEGRFEILSLSGSFLHSEFGGASSRTGGLSVCLSGADGLIVGGGVGGPLIAAGPVQIIIYSFVIDGKKDLDQGGNIDSLDNRSSPFLGTSVTPVSFGPISDSKILGRGNSEHMMGSGFMLQPHAINPRLTWSGCINLEGRGDHNQSLDDGDRHLQD